MLHGFLGAWLALAPPAPATAPPAAGGTNTPGTTIIPFRTDAQPRVDAVFGDAASLRLSVDRFLGLQTDMERVRDDFSTAVHETLTALASNVGVGADPAAAKTCPAATATPYARALAAGTKYLLLGQQLQGRYRDIRRADVLGDAAALTPDYRVKVKRAKELHQQLLDDYREMRVAFYDQLGAEMHHAGCKTGPKAAPAPTDAVAAAAPSPSDPSAWTLDEPASADEVAPAPAAALPAARAQSEAMPPLGATMAAPSIWIDVDNTLCAQPTRVTVDRPTAGRDRRAQEDLRPHARGPAEICALPASDPRTCGDPGTIRKAYLHEGWSLTVHCDK